MSDIGLRPNNLGNLTTKSFWRLTKQASQIGLVATVLFGTWQYDGRFTMLLVPPFLYHWLSSERVSKALSELRVVKWIGDNQLTQRAFGNLGENGSKIALALAGVFAARTMLMFLGVKTAWLGLE